MSERPDDEPVYCPSCGTYTCESANRALKPIERVAAPTVPPESIECTACAASGRARRRSRARCTTCEGAGVLIPCAKCEGAHPVGHPELAAPIERVDPRDFLDPTARAVAYLDLDDTDSARRALAEVSLDRLRRLGEHYDRLSMVCFELASSAHHAADNAVDPASFRAGPDEVAEHPGRPVTSGPAPAPVVEFEVDDLDWLGTEVADVGDRWPGRLLEDDVEVDDLDDLGTADTSERNLP